MFCLLFSFTHLMSANVSKHGQNTSAITTKASSEEIVTTTLDQFERALEELMNLSIDGIEKRQIPMAMAQSSSVSKTNIPQRRRCSSQRRIDQQLHRFIPYEIPANISKALWRHRHHSHTLSGQSTKTAQKSDSDNEAGLQGIQLMNGSEDLQERPAKTLKQAKPCWLQHRQGGQLQQEQQQMEAPAGKGTVKCGEKDEDGKEAPIEEEKSDAGLNELTDYFQHFVCLCSPKMSDLAQSMYA